MYLGEKVGWGGRSVCQVEKDKTVYLHFFKPYRIRTDRFFSGNQNLHLYLEIFNLFIMNELTLTREMFGPIQIPS